MKSLVKLFTCLLNEAGDICSVSTDRDQKAVTARIKHEGLSFLTITLSQFGSDFERSLELGYVDSDLFAGFSRRGGLPKFLSGFLCRVFDSKSGRLLDYPDIATIREIRQITKAFSKVGLPCSETRVDKALKGYVETDEMVRKHQAIWDGPDGQSLTRISNLVFGTVLNIVNTNVYNGEIVPNHGSGSTADGLLGNEKWSLDEWSERMEQLFPFVEYNSPNVREWKSSLSRANHLSLEQERPVKVITVPKTLKTPRVIAMEPTAQMFMQQGLMVSLKREVDRDPLVSSFIGWSTQEPNQLLACLGSLNGNLATLDLSEASDRVSNQHVKRLLANYSWLSSAVQACRSLKADVPKHGVITLAKYASMGSALTFPLESMVFLTVVLRGIELSQDRQLTSRDLYNLSGSVRVYGDDIIVPTRHSNTVRETLEYFGFKVNESKSFQNGKFRESCGKEYYDGIDVSIVKVRSNLPSNRADVSEIVSTVSLRNQLYLAGYWATVVWLDGRIHKCIPFPITEPTSQGLGRRSFLPYQGEKVCDYLHRPLVKACVAVGNPSKNSVDGHAALLKWFTYKASDNGLEPLPPLEEGHLIRSGRPRSLRIQTRWVTPF